MEEDEEEKKTDNSFKKMGIRAPVYYMEHQKIES